MLKIPVPMKWVIAACRHSKWLTEYLSNPWKGTRG